MNAVVDLESRRLPVAVTAQPHDLLRIVVEQNAPIEKIQQLMDLQERWEKNSARKAFNEALSGFRAEQVTVLRSREVSQGPLKGTAYAVLSDFVNAAAPAMSKYGLSAAWRITRDEKEWIEVACVIRHREGHEEETRMGGPPDAGGAKNAIQARASTVSYLEKYTLKMALGLAEQNDDDDGNGGPGNREERPAPEAKAETEKPTLPPYPADQFEKNLPQWAELVHQGKKSVADVLRNIAFKGTLTPEQTKKLTNLEPPK